MTFYGLILSSVTKVFHYKTAHLIRRFHPFFNTCDLNEMIKMKTVNINNLVTAA